MSRIITIIVSVLVVFSLSSCMFLVRGGHHENGGKKDSSKVSDSLSTDSKDSKNGGSK